MQMAPGRDSGRRRMHWGPAPLFIAGMGVVYLAAAAIGGRPVLGLVALGWMLAVAVAVAVASARSEIARMATGEDMDERWRAIDLRATHVTGNALAAVIVGFGVWELAHGEDGYPYTLLALFGGAVYVAALIWFHRRM